MRVFVFGSQGQVARALGEVAARDKTIVMRLSTRNEIDLTRPGSIIDALASFGPDVVINPAAYTSVDLAESEPQLAYAINRDGARAVSLAAGQMNVPIIHFSTDYVFDGQKLGFYEEADLTSPQGVYGRSKLRGEEAVASVNDMNIIFRTSWVYSPFGSNFVKTILRLSQAKGNLRVVDDQWGCPTYAPEIARVVIEIAGKLVASGWKSEYAGVTHLAGPDAVSWCQFARDIAAKLAERGGPGVTVEGIPSSNYPQVAKRPSNSRLSCSRLHTLFNAQMEPMHASLSNCIDRLLQPD
jgi:dTDP-4-dehydrorhamnose reductase